MDNSNNKCLWVLEILIICLISLSFVFASITTYLSLKSDYLPRQYKKNWEMNYLVDIYPTVETTCPQGYETKVIGKWSGFNGGCYCNNNQTGIQIATDEKCFEALSDIFTCYPLIKSPPRNLVWYKGFQFCVKRSNDNYLKLFQKVKSIYSEYNMNKYISNDEINDNDNFQNSRGPRGHRGANENIHYFDYIKILLNSSPPNYIDENAIVDLKLLDNSVYNSTEISKYYMDLSKYEEKKISDTQSLFVLRLRNLNRPQNILDAQKIIVDIHLYNELWCSYLDLSSTQLKSKFSKDDINYGDVDYCENFYSTRNSTLTFNDNFINQNRMNFEFDETPNITDFYLYNGIIDFYSKLKTQNPSNNPNIIKNSMYGNFEPIMTSQNYFFGMGCLYSKDPLEHIEVLNASFQMVRLSGIIVGLQIVNLVMIFFYICAKIDDCSNFRINVSIIMFLISFASMLISLSIDYFSRQNIIYLKDYMIYCQTDFTNNTDNKALKTTEMENKFFEFLLYIYRVSGCTSTLLFLSSCFSLIYLCKFGKNNTNTENVNNQQPIGINNFDISSRSNVIRQPNEIEIKVIEKYDGNNQNKPVENLNSKTPNSVPVYNYTNDLNKNANNNFNNKNNINNNFDVSGFEFSEGDTNKKTPMNFNLMESNREVQNNTNRDGITDRSNVNFNK